MAGHVPPPGASAAVDEAAAVYMAAVQAAVGTTRQLSLLKIGLLGILKLAQRFKVDTIDIYVLMREVESMLLRGRR